MRIGRIAVSEEVRLRASGRGARLSAILAFGLAIAIFVGAGSFTITAAQLKSAPLPASAPKLSDHEIKALPSMNAQQQAQLLMELAITHYEGPIYIIVKNALSWYHH